jgi:hypothetical protein
VNGSQDEAPQVVAESGVERYVIQVLSGGRWRKVRGAEGGPWVRRDRAERLASARERMPRRESSTEGLPHRVVAQVTNGKRGISDVRA